MGLERHPVWDVYNELRTARLNAIYYANRAARSRVMDGGLELLVGLSGASAIAAALAQAMWWTVSAAIVPVVVPVVRSVGGLPDRVRKYNECATGYAVLQFDLEVLRRSIANDHTYGQVHREQFSLALSRRRALIEQEPDHNPDLKLAERCQAQVNREFPLESFYVPS